MINVIAWCLGGKSVCGCHTAVCDRSCSENVRATME